MEIEGRFLEFGIFVLGKVFFILEKLLDQIGYWKINLNWDQNGKLVLDLGFMEKVLGNLENMGEVFVFYIMGQSSTKGDRGYKG